MSSSGLVKCPVAPLGCEMDSVTSSLVPTARTGAGPRHGQAAPRRQSSRIVDTRLPIPKTEGRDNLSHARSAQGQLVQVPVCRWERQETACDKASSSPPTTGWRGWQDSLQKEAKGQVSAERASQWLMEQTALCLSQDKNPGALGHLPCAGHPSQHAPQMTSPGLPQTL